MEHKFNLNRGRSTLVDTVEENLLSYFKEMKYRKGDSIPSETELATELGVARGVLREALSRLRMLGLIETRTRRGMVLAEPDILSGMKRMVDSQLMSEENILDILGMRVAIEIGMADFIFINKTEKDIEELEYIVNRETVLEMNQVSKEEESRFHYKLYEMTSNSTIVNLFQVVAPVFAYIKDNFEDILNEYKKRVADKKRPSHKELVSIIKNGNASQYRNAISRHLEIYFHLLKTQHAR